MNTPNFSRKLSALLNTSLTAEDIYDYDKIKNSIAAVYFKEKDCAPIPCIILSFDDTILLGYRITDTHLTLWNKTLQELLPPIDT